MKKEKKGEGKVRVVIMMGCNSGGVGGVEGKVDLAKKNSFLESLVAIGEGFQEIFAGFGSAVGDVLGFNVVKVGDNRSKVGEHFKKVGEGLTTTKNKLNELKVKISEAKNADGDTIEFVKGAIKGANDVFDKLIVALTKIAGVVGNIDIAAGASDNAAAVAADKDSVDIVIAEVKNVIDAAEKSGVDIVKGDSGNAVESGANNAVEAIAKTAAAGQGAAAKLAGEVSKADPWAMIDKIKNAKTGSQLVNNTTNEVGALTVGTIAQAGAKSNADLVAAVALKAMTKDGKFSANNADAETVKAAVVSAVNKVLGILDVIIRKTVSSNLDKVREAVKGIKYSKTDITDASQSDATK
ncbi:variable large family protein [Borrelia duttonii]|uniref:Variable large protein n=1 Tax=Borrelia duttonii (strain Ly) TaxID=412419 RepID=B5RP68_BORDL|nr:vlp protein, beta subfamily [Borrelia duttonii Ly]